MSKPAGVEPCTDAVDPTRALNLVTFNIGYHNEHHDFPYVPGSRLAELRRLAPEFYEQLLHHDSRLEALWRFLKRRGGFSRAERSFANTSA